ncbi:hypothetical protein JXD20_02030 [Candidatus Peregrinibacteria bacterium]|nr:hypothetical protein [Candidatus Peregrinibacteria bacterium]
MSTNIPETPRQEPESPTSQALGKLKRETETLIRERVDRFMGKLLNRESYAKGDYKTLNKEFIEGYEKEGMNEAAAKRLLISLQNRMFDSLNLRGDRWAVADGEVGPYTIWALSIHYKTRRPKIDIPEGSERLEAKIEKENSDAYRNYKKIFGKESEAGKTYYKFRDIYAKIRRTIDRFNGTVTELGQWLAAAFRAKLSPTEYAVMGMPKVEEVSTAEKSGKSYARNMLCKTTIRENKYYIDETGYMHLEVGDELISRSSPTLEDASEKPVGIKKKPAPESEKKPRLQPLPGVPESLTEKIPPALYLIMLDEGLTFRRVYFERIRGKGNKPNKENPQYFVTSDGRVWDKIGGEVKDPMVVPGALETAQVVAVEADELEALLAPSENTAKQKPKTAPKSKEPVITEAPKVPEPEKKPKIRAPFPELIAEPAEHIDWAESNIAESYPMGPYGEFVYHTKKEGAWIDRQGNRLNPEKLFSKIKEKGPSDPTGRLGFSTKRNYGIRGLDGVLRYFNQDGEEVRAANSTERIREVIAGVPLEKADEKQKKTAFEKFRKGKAEYEKGNYEKAFSLLRESYSIVASPNTHFMITYCLRALGYESEARREAKRTLEETKTDPEKYKVTAEETKKILAQLEPDKKKKDETVA